MNDSLHRSPRRRDLPRRACLLVELIPQGRLLTYGEVATLCGSPRAARAVGQALRRSIGSPHLPWHRVINASGAVSIRGDHERALLQIDRLREEGIPCEDDGRIVNFAQYRWPLREAIVHARDAGLEPGRLDEILRTP